MCSDILSAEMTMKQLSLLIRCISYVIKHNIEVKHPKKKCIKYTVAYKITLVDLALRIMH